MYQGMCGSSCCRYYNWLNYQLWIIIIIIIIVVVVVVVVIAVLAQSV
jgi:hypothetical protein